MFRLAGDILNDQIDSQNEITIGMGLKVMEEEGDQASEMEQESVQFTQSGLLIHANDKFWVETDQKFYSPAVGDSILGVVCGKIGELELYRIDYGGAVCGLLPFLAFENATRRNRPNLKNGDLVYARVTAVVRADIECELSCVNEDGKSSGYGALQDGLTIQISCNYARRLFNSTMLKSKNLPAVYQQQQCLISTVLFELGKRVAFECAVGMNGLLWIKCGSVKQMILIKRVVLDCEFMNKSLTLQRVKKALNEMEID
ncbi:hypothetical protein MIR68_004946 [Amoeboaphelidium protococcarum]|nr:hypothetical protein MIR68_004946 [Amoeboaphelidium protococcarum]